MKPLSEAVLKSKKSSVRKLFDLLVQSGADAISFGIGQPHFTAPDYANDAIIKALRDHRTQYAPTLGVMQLRQIVADKFHRENHIPAIDEKNIVITNGGSQALELAFAVLGNPGDEIILSSPNFLSYFYLAEYNHLNCIEIPRLPDYSPNLDIMEQKITPKTKFIVVNTPNNPTGYGYVKSQMDRLVEIVHKHDLYLISDEVYEKFRYDNEPHISPASYPNMAERVITINALSKTFGATGYRCGYLAANETIIQNMEKWIQYTTAGVNHPIQYGAIEALIRGNLDLPEILKEYNKKRLYCIKRLRECQFDVVEPKGAFYIMPRLPASWHVTGDVFCSQLMEEEHLACVPGEGFGSYSGNSIRISYATTDGQLEEGFNRMEKFLKRHEKI